MTGEAFRAALIRLNIGQDAFAVVLGVSSSAMSKWCTGVRKPPRAVQLLVGIMENFEVELEDLTVLRDID
jgi:DNA-binding transcriptional regulator YiaG